MIVKIKRFEALKSGGYYEAVELQRDTWTDSHGDERAQWRVVREGGDTPAGDVLGSAAYHHVYERADEAAARRCYQEHAAAIERTADND